MHTCLKPYLNYFKQQIQQKNSGKIKISEKLKIRKYNIKPNYGREKSKKISGITVITIIIIKKW